LQAFNGPNKDGNKAQRTLEINPRHPLIKSLSEKVAADAADSKETAMVLFETALLESGFELDDNRWVYFWVRDRCGG
jgi:HSP90 family molecular chaperone